MAKAKYFLVAGGVISGLISLLHVILAVKPALYQYFGPDQASTLSQLAVQGSSLTTIVTFTLAMIFAIWAIYAFSGAGLIRRLPPLRMALITIGVIYILRSLFLPTEIRMVMNEGYAFRFVIFSTISLIAGLMYLIGVVMLRAISKPGK